MTGSFGARVVWISLRARELWTLGGGAGAACSGVGLGMFALVVMYNVYIIVQI